MYIFFLASFYSASGIGTSPITLQFSQSFDTEINVWASEGGNVTEALTGINSAVSIAQAGAGVCFIFVLLFLFCLPGPATASIQLPCDEMNILKLVVVLRNNGQGFSTLVRKTYSSFFLLLFF